MLGNHDWGGDPKAQLEHANHDPLWRIDDFFYTFNYTTPAGQIVAVVVIDTDLLSYGYEGYNQKMHDNFVSVGWTRESNAIERQLAWIDQALSNNSNADYLIVAGHHPVTICKASTDLKKIVRIMEKYDVTAYTYGHRVWVSR